MQMNRRHFLQSAGALALASALPLTSCNKTTRPNFLFILVDDLGWRDLGCFGSSFYETPNIDKIAAQGMKFTNAYAACQVCSPTRASIMSGKYPARLDCTDWFGAPQPTNVQKHWTKNKPLVPAPYNEQLPVEEATVAEALHEAGYQTFFAGKWHLGPTEEFWPENQGFDINKGGHHKGSPPGGYFSPYDNPRLESGPDGEHLPDRLANETVQFIKDRNPGQSFLAYLSFYSVHNPQQGRDDLVEKYRKKAETLVSDQPEWIPEGDNMARQIQNRPVYAAMVEAMDEAVGKVYNELLKQNLADKTIIIFMSDNGGLSTAEGSPTSNLPLRAGKGWIYEGGIREPMFIVWPDMVKPGTECHTPVISTDFYPTMLQMADLPLRNEQHVDGVSLLPLLMQTGNLDREAIFWHYPHYGNQGGSPNSAVRMDEWKLIEFFEDGHLELYNLIKDIGEQENLADQYPDRVKKMHEKLIAWRKDVDAKYPAPNPLI